MNIFPLYKLKKIKLDEKAMMLLGIIYGCILVLIFFSAYCIIYFRRSLFNDDYEVNSTSPVSSSDDSNYNSIFYITTNNNNDDDEDLENGRGINMRQI